ncbi:MAG: hypothetical protein MI919_25595 [Holophagales bacterium]|nr:hypothetical protein [Holophagales bacterium]
MLDSSLLTLLIGFLSGYLLQSGSYPLSFRYLRLSGYRSLFEAILWSLPFLIAGRLICSWIGQRWPEIYGLWHRHFPMPWLGTALVAVALSASVVLLTNLGFARLGRGRNPSLAKAIARFGNELEKLLSESVSEQELLQITLDNRKVYIGRALFPEVEDRELSHIELIPILSGHRHPKDLRLVIDTDYFAAYEALLESDNGNGLAPDRIEGPAQVSIENLEDLRIVIPVSRLLSVATFNEELFLLTDDEPPVDELQSPGAESPGGAASEDSPSSFPTSPGKSTGISSPWRPLLAWILKQLLRVLRARTSPADRD